MTLGSFQDFFLSTWSWYHQLNLKTSSLWSSIMPYHPSWSCEMHFFLLSQHFSTSLHSTLWFWYFQYLEKWLAISVDISFGVKFPLFPPICLFDCDRLTAIWCLMVLLMISAFNCFPPLPAENQRPSQSESPATKLSLSIKTTAGDLLFSQNCQIPLQLKAPSLSVWWNRSVNQWFGTRSISQLWEIFCTSFCNCNLPKCNVSSLKERDGSNQTAQDWYFHENWAPISEM